jgi:hypothetical protein
VFGVLRGDFSHASFEMLSFHGRVCHFLSQIFIFLKNINFFSLFFQAISAIYEIFGMIERAFA